MWPQIDDKNMEQLEADEDKDREETVDEKIDRLGKEIQDLKEQVRMILTCLPPITRPPVPEPLLKLRRAIKEKDTERELLLEDQRASKVVEEYLQENQTVLDNINDCPICLERIFDINGAVDFLCCGKVTCKGCADSLSAAANDTCPLCRGRIPSEGEALSILHPKAAAGHAWAESFLGSNYYSGVLGLSVDRQKAESLFRSAADQGYSNAQYFLGIVESKRNNHSEACQLFEAAASQGHMNALGRLGMHYQIGEGVEKDDIEAVRLATISAKLQSSDLCVNEVLGYYFAKEEGGLKRSMVRSMHYMKAAIERTELSPDMMILYAVTLLAISAFYYPDCRVPPSGHNYFPEALFWFRFARAKGMDAETVTVLESVESSVKQFCACCYKRLSTDKPKCCIECKAAYYCSRECQAADWKAGHKKDCVKSLKKRLRATGKFDDI